MGCLQLGMRFLPLYLALVCGAVLLALDALVRLRLRKVGAQSRPFQGSLFQPRKVSQITKAASLVRMASLLELDGLVGGHRANAFESPVQRRPPAYWVLSNRDLQQLEPVGVHFGKKITLDRISRNRTDDRINTAPWAKRRIAIVRPVLNLVRRKHFKTVEAAAEVALPECRAIVARPFVGADVVFRDGKLSQGTIHVSLNAFPVALVLV